MVAKEKVKKTYPPCRAACPAHVNVQAYVCLLQRGKFKDAVETIREDMPFPAICGRVCFAPCEKACARINVDQAVAIRTLKKVVADVEREQGRIRPKPIMKKYDKKVAIIGAGPAGLTAGYELARLGYPVIVFESMSEPGGMMRHKIPGQLLEKFVVANEIAFIQDLGLELRCNVEFGRDINLEDLRSQGYEAVFIASGKLPETSPLPEELLKREPTGPVVPVDPITLETKIRGVFAGGDIVRGKPAGIIEAVSAGKRAAESIRRYFNGVDLKAGREEVEETTWVKDWGPVEKKQTRYAAKKGDPKPRVSFEEADEAMDKIKRKAVFEAFRCLGCGPCAECLQKTGICEADKPVVDEDLCIGCNICAEACPFGAMSKNSEEVAQINEQLCKSCGICAARCPENAITMEQLKDGRVVNCALAPFGG